jgi:Arc/MetJ-type ribon-helix-helix transcriptional regulator
MFFERLITLRIREGYLEEINNIVSVNQDRYDGTSHFIRCAIIKLINEELRSGNNGRKTNKLRQVQQTNNNKPYKRKAS